MNLIKIKKGMCRIDPEMPRGAYIPPEELEAALKMERTAPKYNFALMAMIGDFWKATCEADDPKAVCVDKGGIRVMTDDEAAEYGALGWRKRLAGTLALRERTIRAVRTSQLTPEQLAEHKDWVTRTSVLADSLSAHEQAEQLHEMHRSAALRAHEAEPDFDPFAKDEE